MTLSAKTKLLQCTFYSLNEEGRMSQTQVICDYFEEYRIHLRQEQSLGVSCVRWAEPISVGRKPIGEGLRRARRHKLTRLLNDHGSDQSSGSEVEVKQTVKVIRKDEDSAAENTCDNGDVWKCTKSVLKPVSPNVDVTKNGMKYEELCGDNVHSYLTETRLTDLGDGDKGLDESDEQLIIDDVDKIDVELLNDVTLVDNSEEDTKDGGELLSGADEENIGEGFYTEDMGHRTVEHWKPREGSINRHSKTRNDDVTQKNSDKSDSDGDFMIVAATNRRVTKRTIKQISKPASDDDLIPPVFCSPQPRMDLFLEEQSLPLSPNKVIPESEHFTRSPLNALSMRKRKYTTNMRDKTMFDNLFCRKKNRTDVDNEKTDDMVIVLDDDSERGEFLDDGGRRENLEQTHRLSPANVSCPICGKLFTKREVERHAATCEGPADELPDLTSHGDDAGSTGSHEDRDRGGTTMQTCELCHNQFSDGREIEEHFVSCFNERVKRESGAWSNTRSEAAHSGGNGRDSGGAVVTATYSKKRPLVRGDPRISTPYSSTTSGTEDERP